jgi:predicted outer membrane repeat protein
VINKLFKTILISTIIFAILWGFSDSYSSHTIENIVHIVAIGIDKCIDNNENMKVSFQFVNISSGGNGDSSGEGSSTVVTSINASSLNKAINLMNSYIGKELNFSHCKVIVFSEDFAKEGISTEIYTLINNEEFRPSTNIIISTSDANSYLKNANPNIEKLVTNYYDTFELTSNFTGYSDDMTLGRFYNNLFTSSKANTAILGRTFKKASDSQDSSQGEGQSSSSENTSQEKQGENKEHGVSSEINSQNDNFINNSVEYNGGAVYAYEASIENSSFDSNTAVNGGGLFATDSNVNNSNFDFFFRKFRFTINYAISERNHHKRICRDTKRHSILLWAHTIFMHF